MKIAMKKTGASKKRRLELRAKMLALVTEYKDVPTLVANQLLVESNEVLDLTSVDFVIVLNDFDIRVKK